MSTNTEKIRVLFVCMGNICRSPTGEGVFKHYVDERGLNHRFEIDSAGTIGHHSGANADARMTAAARRRGYQLMSLARQVSEDDLDTFDLIIPMDHENLIDLERLAGGPSDVIRLLGSFLPNAVDNDSARSVPDPYYGGAAGFEEVLDMMELACDGIFQHCVAITEAKFPRQKR